MLLLLDGYKMTVKFPQNFTEKSTLNTNDIVLLADSEDLLDWIPKADKKFTLTSLINFLKGKLSTTDVTEWTNLYYTDARVAASAYATANDAAVAARELLTNKKTDFTVIDNTAYATTQAIVNYIASLGIDITWRTEETTIATDDEIIFYDTSTTSNKKITSDNLNISLQKSQYIWVLASDTLQQSADTERTHNIENDLIKRKEIYIPIQYLKWWTIRVKCEAKTTNTIWSTNQLKFYKNWALHSQHTLTLSYVEYSTDISVSPEDLIQWYIRPDVALETVYIRNFRIYFDEVEYTKTPTVNLD